VTPRRLPQRATLVVHLRVRRFSGCKSAAASLFAARDLAEGPLAVSRGRAFFSVGRFPGAPHEPSVRSRPVAEVGAWARGASTPNLLDNTPPAPPHRLAFQERFKHSVAGHLQAELFGHAVVLFSDPAVFHV